MLWFPGCVTDGTDFEALPFVRIDRTEPGITRIDVPPLLLTVDTYPAHKPAPDADQVEDEQTEDEDEGRDYLVRFPYPFGLFQKRGKHRSWAISSLVLDDGSRNSGPLGRSMSSEDGVSDDLLPPFASDPTDGGLTALPLTFSFTSVDHNDIPDVEGEALDTDISLWPFLAFGYGDKDEDDYFALAPFGGVTKGILGKKKITWVGFPYPFYMSIEDRAYDSTHILFPFINWIDGPQNKGFRILPFYAHYERKGARGNSIYEKTWIMWPFFTWSRSGLNDEPTETLFLFPFYGSTKSKDLVSYTLLWPFFRYTKKNDDERGHSWELNAPFPFLQIAGGRDSWRFSLWPLFGLKSRKGYFSHFLLWPIWRKEDMETEDKTFSGTWLLPLFWRTKWEYRDTGQDEHRVRALPFFHYRKYKDGALDVGGLSPWVFDDEGFERVFHPFLRLFRYTRDTDGGTEHQALFGLFSYRDLPAAPERGKNAYSRLSLLFGLFQYRNKGGEKALRFLWLPEFPTWGEAAIPSGAPGASSSRTRSNVRGRVRVGRPL